MENTSIDEVAESKSALCSISNNNNTDNNFALKDDGCNTEDSNSMMDATLNYLTKILLEEEIHERDIEYQNSHDLWAIEKHFYSILGQEYPLPLTKLSLSDKPDANPTSRNYSSLQNQFSSSSTNVFVSSINQPKAQDIYVLSSADKMASNSQPNKIFFPSKHKVSVDCVQVNLENEDNKKILTTINGFRGKKKFNEEDLKPIEERNRKISVPFVEEPARDPTFDEVLLYDDFYTKEVASLKDIMQTKPRDENKIQEKVLDLDDILIRCSHSVASDDRKAAEALIKEIRMYSSPEGDGKQRLACVLVDALESRLTATGNESYNRFVTKRISTTDILRVHQLDMTSSPHAGIYIYFANQTILKAVDKASKLHIIDFGINYGFQYPSLIQILSKKCRGVKLRITGIELPQPGFRPAKLIEETGRRLEEYAKIFDVPFEYHGIVSRWENLHVNDFKMEEDEVLIVNSICRFRQLGDERINFDCPRDQVLKLIRHLRPNLFIYAILSWTFSPFFITRFKQVMSLYEKYFDLLDALTPRDSRIRKILERDVLGRYVTNAIACEGTSLIERPETYKKWHQRTLRAGFEQIPLDPIIVKKCNETLMKFFHGKGFFVEEENNWLLQGWRGRILYGLSIWKPNS